MIAKNSIGIQKDYTLWLKSHTNMYFHENQNCNICGRIFSSRTSVRTLPPKLLVSRLLKK